MITLNQLSMTYGNKVLFTDVNLILNHNQRYALVGANGCGKSTLLRLLSGEETPDEGTVMCPKGAQIGFLKQDQFQYEDTRILDVVLNGKPALWKAWQEKEKLLALDEWDEATGYRLGELEEIIAHQQGYTALTKAENLLLGLGITQDYHAQPLQALSGGFKLRVLLAKTLFQEPDILLLDEPTNHLDIVSIEWLEKYLKTEFSGLLLFISHDVRFINQLAQSILDVDYGEIRAYSSPYHCFLNEKELLATQKLQEKKSLEDKVAKLQDFVDRFSAGTRSKQAQSRVKQMERLEIPDQKNSSRIAPAFHFSPHRPSGKTVLKVKQLGKKFGPKNLFSNTHFQVNRGEKLAVLGANGTGKSTLLKILMGFLTPDEGEYEWGHETHIAYVSQDQHDLLKGSSSVLEWLEHESSHLSTSEVRKILGQVLFTQDTVHKNIQSLSGGEGLRLLLARAMCQKANVLIFDEPTNHLDLESIEQLGEALKNYAGTVLLVSHHREFIEHMANRILFLNHHQFIDFKGHYKAFQKQYGF